MPEQRSDQTDGDSTPLSLTERVGILVVRVIIPAWILSGALLKYGSRDPSLMPEKFRSILHFFELDLKLSLVGLLVIECFAIAILLAIPRWARLTALIMMISFVLVLLLELVTGNMSNCGCLGSYSPPPWVMLAIDAVLLLLVICTHFPKSMSLRCRSRLAVIQAIVMASVASLIAVVWVLDKPMVAGSTLPPPVAAPLPETETSSGPADASSPPESTAPDAAVYGAIGSSVVTAAPSAMPERAWYELDTSEWVGQNIRDIDLVGYMRGLPASIDQGDQYLILYSRTCDHCHLLLDYHFGFGSPVPTTLVAVPESIEGFATEGLMDNPCLDCLHAELPPGVNWIMTPPVVLALRDGEVLCAQEGEDYESPSCLQFH